MRRKKTKSQEEKVCDCSSETIQTGKVTIHEAASKKAFKEDIEMKAEQFWLKRHSVYKMHLINNLDYWERTFANRNEGISRASDANL